MKCVQRHEYVFRLVFYRVSPAERSLNRRLLAVIHSGTDIDGMVVIGEVDVHVLCWCCTFLRFFLNEVGNRTSLFPDLLVEYSVEPNLAIADANSRGLFTW